MMIFRMIFVYIHRLYAQKVMVECVEEEFSAMKEGLHEVIPAELLEPLTTEVQNFFLLNFFIFVCLSACVFVIFIFICCFVLFCFVCLFWLLYQNVKSSAKHFMERFCEQPHLILRSS